MDGAKRNLRSSAEISDSELLTSAGMIARRGNWEEKKLVIALADHPHRAVSELAKRTKEEWDEHQRRLERQEARGNELVMLIASGVESNDYDGYHGTHTVTTDEGVMTRREAERRSGERAYNLLGGHATYSYRELTDEEREATKHDKSL